MGRGRVQAPHQSPILTVSHSQSRSLRYPILAVSHSHSRSTPLSFSQSLIPILAVPRYHSRSLSFPFSQYPVIILAVSHSRSLSFSQSPILAVSHSRSPPFSQSPILAVPHSRSLSFSQSLILAVPHSRSLSFSQSPILTCAGPRCGLSSRQLRGECLRERREGGPAQQCPLPCGLRCEGAWGERGGERGEVSQGSCDVSTSGPHQYTILTQMS